MSKIQEILEKFTEQAPSKKRDETVNSQDYLKRVAQAVGQLSDDDWKALGTDAQNWYNSTIDAIEAGKDLPGYPDVEPPASAGGTRRRAAGGGATPAAAEPYVPKVGDEVKATTKRGKVYEGKLVEKDGTLLVIKTKDGDEEVDTERLESIVKAGGGSTSAAEDPEPLEPEVGDTVEVKTKRGKVVMGNITVITDEELVLQTAAGDVEEFIRDRIETLTMKSKNAGKGGSKAGAGKGETKPDDNKPAGTSRRTTAADNGGVSVTSRVRELMVDNLDWKKDQIGAQLKKEGMEFKQSTVDLMFNEAHKLFALLRDRKLLK